MTDGQTSTATLRQKVEDLTRQTAAKVAAICRRYCVQSDAADAMIADIAQMLHARYAGLYATTEQMREVSQKVKRQAWNNTGNGAVCFTAQYYGEICNIIDNVPPFPGDTYLHAVSILEAARRQGTTPDDMAARYGGQLFDTDLQANAQRLYYLYGVLVVAEFTDATEAELLSIPPADNVSPEEQRRLIASALDFQAQRRRIEAAAAGRKAKRQKQPTDKTPGLFDGDKTIALYQNITNMLSGGIQTADNYNSNTPLRPLRTALREQSERAEVVLTDANAPEEDKRKAAQFLANTTGVAQAIDAVQVIIQTMQPDASGGTGDSFDFTPHQLAVVCTGQDSPNKEQVLNCLRAFAWLSTQRMQVWEKTQKTIQTTDADGKKTKKKVYRDICTNFQPVTIEFRTAYEDKVLIEEATRVRLSIHNIIRDGRSAEYSIDDSSGRKERLYIMPPRKHILTLAQYYDFQSDEERTFRDTIVSKGNQAEDKLLAAVFDYKGRQAEYERSANEARRIADALRDSTTATAEQKQAAEQAAKQASDKAKYYITNHMGADAERLKAMFNKARENGLLAWYDRKDVRLNNSPRKYGSGFVWYWGRPNAEAVQRRKNSRRSKA